MKTDRAQAKPRFEEKDYASSTERAYAALLEQRLRAGEIKAWLYEPWRLLLADRTTYTPDFLVITTENFLECHEVKGFWRDDARVKIKVASRQHPYLRFLAVTLKKKQWTYEEINT